MRLNHERNGAWISDLLAEIFSFTMLFLRFVLIEKIHQTHETWLCNAFEGYNTSDIVYHERTLHNLSYHIEVLHGSHVAWQGQ